MKRSLIVLLMAVVLPFALAPASVRAESEPGYYQITDQEDSAEEGLLYPEELDDLLARIALYPDPLIAQILPAATFVDQIHEAARFVRFYGNTSRIDYQPWDISVRAVAHYPQVLYMMDREYQWTASLGQAYIEQPQDVMDSVQRLRRYAKEQGNLYSTREQQVIFDGDIIRIDPARPQLVYVPVYDPNVIYVERYYASSPFITFGTGFYIGPWLNRDCDWRERRVYYHGWRGRGWVNRSRPHIHDRRGIYINSRASVITVNERVVQRDTRPYRQQLRVESRRHREEGRMPSVGTRERRPARVEQPRQRVEQSKPGRVERPGPGSQRRREPWTGRQAPPATGVQAPGIAPPKAGTTAPEAIKRQPAAVQPLAPQVAPQSEAAPQQAQPDTRQPQVTPGKQQPPAATGERPAGRPGKGEKRRREPRQVNRPGDQAPAPAASDMAPGLATPAPRVPAVRGAAPPTARPARVPAATPATPARPVAPRHTVIPRAEPAQPPTVSPAPNAAEPAEPARPAHESGPGQGRGRGGESSGGRGLHRDRGEER
jgi:hypothetical protein